MVPVVNYFRLNTHYDIFSIKLNTHFNFDLIYNSFWIAVDLILFIKIDYFFIFLISFLLFNTFISIKDLLINYSIDLFLSLYLLN